MRIKMAASISGTRNGVEWPAKGEVLDLPQNEAEDLVRGQLAIEVTEIEAAILPGKIETAVVDNRPRRGRPRKEH